MSARRERVVLSDQEKALVVGKAIELAALKLWDSPLTLFREAQKVLPLERRRTTRSLGEVEWFAPMYDHALLDRVTLGHEVDLTQIVRNGYAIQHEIIMTNLGEQQQHGRTLSRIEALLAPLPRIEALLTRIAERLEQPPLRSSA
jgi:hypothetical protein